MSQQTREHTFVRSKRPGLTWNSLPQTAQILFTLRSRAPEAAVALRGREFVDDFERDLFDRQDHGLGDTVAFFDFQNVVWAAAVAVQFDEHLMSVV